MSEVFCAKGPEPRAVSTVAIVGHEESRERRSTDSKTNGRPHNEWEHCKSQHMQLNRDKTQIAKDDEARYREKQ